jgi:Cof subfamily protein (haloacid dehalogenase superfamily)/HAD superfamily hydrolase (TIGR01509 family)
MAMTPIKMLIADVDGTLLTKNKVLTDGTCQAVARLRAAGILFGITSGRPPRGMAMLTKPLNLTTPVAACNGGMFVRPDLTTVIDQRTLSLAVASEVVDYLEESGLDVWVFRGVDWFLREADAFRVDREQRNLQFAPTVVRDVRTVLEGAVKIVGVTPDEALLARCEAELRQRIGSHASAARSSTHYLDVTHPDANKGTVVRLASLNLNIPVEQIAVIGDMPNDVLMFGVAGTSIAMGNSSPEVKRTARYVTSSNEEEGFANAVDWFVRHEPRTAQETLGLPPRTRACLFEIDGVLTQTDRLHALAWKQTLDDHLSERSNRTGQPFVPFDPIVDYTLYAEGRLGADAARSFLASRGVVPPQEVLNDLASRKDELTAQLLTSERVEAYDSSVRFLKAARKAGLRTAVVSASQHCNELLAASGIADMFDACIDGVVAAEKHFAGKPAPDSFLAAAQAVGVDPAHSAVFEDGLFGVEAGRAGHFGYVVGVDRVGQAAELRRHGADIVVNDLAAMLQ